MKGLAALVAGLLGISFFLGLLCLSGFGAWSASAAAQPCVGSLPPGMGGGGGVPSRSNPALWRAIGAVTGGSPDLALAMGVGSWLESGWDDRASGGGGYGDYQIQLDAHPGVALQDAESPVWATHFMAPSYRRAVLGVPTGLWARDPSRAAEETAVLAERPSGYPDPLAYYKHQGAARISSAYRAAVGAMRKAHIPTAFSRAPAGQAPSRAAPSRMTCPSPGGAGTRPVTAQAAKVVSFARSQLGLPYVWGGTGPDGYDCSGLTQAAWATAGMAIPRTSQAQWVAVRHVSRPRPGDLVFFAGSDGTVASPGHVGVYVSPGLMIDAPYTGVDIRYDHFTRGPGFTGYGRP